MNQKKLIATLWVLVVILAGTTVYFAVTKNASQSVSPVIKNLQPTSGKSGSTAQLANTAWKNYSLSGLLSLKYPTQWCGSNGSCHDLYVIESEGHDIVTLGQMVKDSDSGDYIDPVLTINYLTSINGNKIDQKSAEKYLINKYQNSPYLVNSVSWEIDKNNSTVKVAKLGQFLHAAYEDGVLAEFALQPACLLDCKIDGGILSSIKLDGAQLYPDYKN